MSKFESDSDSEISAAQSRRIDAERQKELKKRLKKETKELEKQEVLALEVKVKDEKKPNPVKKISKKEVLVTRKEFKKLNEDINSNHIERAIRAQIRSENEKIPLEIPKEAPSEVLKESKQKLYKNYWGGYLQSSLSQGNKKEQLQGQKKSQKNLPKPDIYSIKTLQVYLLKQKPFCPKALP